MTGAARTILLDALSSRFEAAGVPQMLNECTSACDLILRASRGNARGTSISVYLANLIIECGFVSLVLLFTAQKLENDDFLEVANLVVRKLRHELDLDDVMAAIAAGG